MSETVRILALSGSLRRGSFNTAALRACRELAPQQARIEIAPLREIPLYDEDLRERTGFPAPVDGLREQIRAADALLIATPEYNYSVPGVLKNAIDWISRPPNQPFADKPAAVFSVSPGITGGIRAQWALKPVLSGLGALVLPRPEVAIGDARTKFDDAGVLADEATRERLSTFLRAFVNWIERLRAGGAHQKAQAP